MKPKRIIITLAACLSLAVTAQAVTTNVLDWTFSIAGNPVAPNLPTTINPSGGNPQATIFGNINTYFFGSAANQPSLYGSPTGIWDIEGSAGHMTLSLNLTGAQKVVGYNVQIYQFADEGRAFYPGNLTLSPSGAQFVSESVYVPQSGSMIGAWYLDTYSWNSVVPSSSLSLDIAPGAGSSAMLFDEVKLTVLVDVPEPSSGLIAMVGLLAYGVRSWLRRNR
jgi:hypothetical protein